MIIGVIMCWVGGCSFLEKGIRFWGWRTLEDWGSKRTWEVPVEEKSMNFALSGEDVLCQSKWIDGLSLIVTRLR